MPRTCRSHAPRPQTIDTVLVVLNLPVAPADKLEKLVKFVTDIYSRVSVPAEVRQARAARRLRPRWHAHCPALHRLLARRWARWWMAV